MKTPDTLNAPLPWRVNTDNGQMGDICDANGDSVAQVQPRGSLRRQNIEERQELAALIVQRVNADSALYEVLERLADTYGDEIPAKSKVGRDALIAARAALASATPQATEN